ncbi:MAG: FAD-dependent oxidoreductase [Desulfarculus sp.]|nr:FAD-dependent oxidoreductase [Pseudomonadota bacterium]MBU4596681.1 FAD-dependent oxidoreductase [Pseudomonadota bacterium]MBV1716916.1 FAD-dependent oxidoreductase [Desulfarculus sp.]MBV1738419.1 FAD-dependent oxidoreductase [Desulfarculus sp.]MBV1753146.1 FAD-dependent oxidoreductase [Desulfarculus sp.]
MYDAVVLGGGYSGLAAARSLMRGGAGSLLLEASGGLGGAGRCGPVAGESVEWFYHHIKPHDTELLELIGEMGLTGSLLWQETSMAFYLEGRLYPFSRPQDLLRFAPFNLADKLRFCAGMLSSRFTQSQNLTGMSAKDWIVRHWGQSVYHKMMAPMMRNKFGIPPERVCAGFLHGRIKGLAATKAKGVSGEMLGYLDGGLDRLARRLGDELTQGADVRLNSPATALERTKDGYLVHAGGQSHAARVVINTLPLNRFALLPVNFSFESRVKYQGVACALMALDRTLELPYWTNILEPGFSSKVVVNQSLLGHHRANLVYCSAYLADEHPLITAPANQVRDTYLKDLRAMVGPVELVDCLVTQSPVATPVFDVDYHQQTHDLQNRLPGVFFAGNATIYPHSRTISSVICSGRRAAGMALERLASGSRAA